MEVNNTHTPTILLFFSFSLGIESLTESIDGIDLPPGDHQLASTSCIIRCVNEREGRLEKSDWMGCSAPK